MKIHHLENLIQQVREPHTLIHLLGIYLKMHKTALENKIDGYIPAEEARMLKTQLKMQALEEAEVNFSDFENALNGGELKRLLLQKGVSTTEIDRLITLLSNLKKGIDDPDPEMRRDFSSVEISNENLDIFKRLRKVERLTNINKYKKEIVQELERNFQARQHDEQIKREKSIREAEEERSIRQALMTSPLSSLDEKLDEEMGEGHQTTSQVILNKHKKVFVETFQIGSASLPGALSQLVLDYVISDHILSLYDIFRRLYSSKDSSVNTLGLINLLLVPKYLNLINTHEDFIVLLQLIGLNNPDIKPSPSYLLETEEFTQFLSHRIANYNGLKKHLILFADAPDKLLSFLRRDQLQHIFWIDRFDNLIAISHAAPSSIPHLINALTPQFFIQNGDFESNTVRDNAFRLLNESHPATIKDIIVGLKPLWEKMASIYCEFYACIGYEGDRFPNELMQIPPSHFELYLQSVNNDHYAKILLSTYRSEHAEEYMSKLSAKTIAMLVMNQCIDFHTIPSVIKKLPIDKQERFFEDLMSTLKPYWKAEICQKWQDTFNALSEKNQLTLINSLDDYIRGELFKQWVYRGLSLKNCVAFLEKTPEEYLRTHGDNDNINNPIKNLLFRLDNYRGVFLSQHQYLTFLYQYMALKRTESDSFWGYSVSDKIKACKQLVQVVSEQASLDTLDPYKNILTNGNLGKFFKKASLILEYIKYCDLSFVLEVFGLGKKIIFSEQFKPFLKNKLEDWKTLNPQHPLAIQVNSLGVDFFYADHLLCINILIRHAKNNKDLLKYTTVLLDHIEHMPTFKSQLGALENMLKDLQNRIAADCKQQETLTTQLKLPSAISGLTDAVKNWSAASSSSSSLGSSSAVASTHSYYSSSLWNAASSSSSSSLTPAEVARRSAAAMTPDELARRRAAGAAAPAEPNNQLGR